MVGKRAGSFVWRRNRVLRISSLISVIFISHFIPAGVHNIPNNQVKDNSTFRLEEEKEEQEQWTHLASWEEVI
ncbi:MAG: hypothetical protein DRI99_00170 [Candidatus Aminicenantes bacterium]|nr:MAG: hypothetical protein DRI99_00170 [Candidatus Aminicenantes bacterium]